ncbi:Uncharacterised protein [uncultured archaeon]|nr:Uncharacterised protein [uncultured archaeon]
MLAVKPLRETEWEVTLLLAPAELGYEPLEVPYMTLVLLFMSVAHVMVADVWVIEVLATLEITGAGVGADEATEKLIW